MTITLTDDQYDTLRIMVSHDLRIEKGELRSLEKDLADPTRYQRRGKHTEAAVKSQREFVETLKGVAKAFKLEVE